MKTEPLSLSISTTHARKHLSEIVTRIQDPRSFCLLTRHNKPVAAIASMESYERISRQKDIERLRKKGSRAFQFRWVSRDFKSPQLAAEAVQEVQLDRWEERAVLAQGGLEPIPGGEVAAESKAPAARKWWQWPNLKGRKTRGEA